MKFPLVIVQLLLWSATLAFAQNPHPIVKAVFANNEPVSLKGDTVFVNSSDQLSFVFSASRQEGKLYYLLEEQDPEYKEEQLPVAFYTQLKAGTYQFKSYLQNQYGQQNAPPLTVVVKGSFMGKWWFIPLLILYLLLLFGGAVYFIMLSNFRNKEKLSELRNDWTNKLHNDIGGDLSSVALRLQTLKRKLEPLDPKVKKGVIKTYDILESIQKKLRFVFDLVDPKKDSLQVMLSDVKDFAEQNLSLKNIAFHYRNELTEEQENKLDIGRINKLYLALKEVINNSVKYSDATLVSMHLEHQKEGLLMVIKDDGKGFDQTVPPKGNGLKNLKQYSQEGFLDIQIHSEVGKGTTATILVPEI